MIAATRLAAITAVATFALLLVGTYVRAEGAGARIPGLAFDGGTARASFGPPGAAEMFAHRMLAVVVAALALWLVIRARTMPVRSGRLVRLSTLAVGLFFGQIALGGVNVVTELSTWPRALHVALSAAIWAVVVALAVARVGVSRLAEPAPSPDAGQLAGVAERAPVSGTITAYYRLTKPRIIVLLLITTVPAMVLAQRGMLLAVAGARDPRRRLARRGRGQRHQHVPRPRHRRGDATPRGKGRCRRTRSLPERALAFGFWLGAFSFVFLGVTVNVLAATLSLAAIAFYVVVYRCG